MYTDCYRLSSLQYTASCLQLVKQIQGATFKYATPTSKFPQYNHAHSVLFLPRNSDPAVGQGTLQIF